MVRLQVRRATRELLDLLGIDSLYPVQEEAIKAKVEYGESLVVSAPTASGKTLVALMAIVNSLNDNPDTIAVYTSPLRSIAYEKLASFQILEKMGLKVRLEVGNLSRGPRNSHILITTYEKFDSMVRNDPGIIRRISTVVVDEVHYIGDAKRGPVVETILATLKRSDPQVVALSATIPNAKEIADWLGARLVYSDWRPVPLREGVYKDGEIIFPDGRVEDVAPVTGTPYVDLIIHYSRGGGQLLVFSQSRRRVVQTARQTARYHKHIDYDPREASRVARKIMDTSGPLSLREELARLVSRGVAFHHAGLSNEQRMIIEEAFREGILVSIHATPTLAAGVNLPARAVIVEEYVRYEAGTRSLISVSEYKQLAGRAGRPGYDDVGDAIIIARKSDEPEDLLEYYILSPPEPVDSRIGSVRALRHVVLGLVDSRVLASKDSIREFAKHTFYAYQHGEHTIASLAERAIDDLEAWGLIDYGEDPKTTSLGSLVARLYLDPYSVPVARRILSRIGGRPSEIVLLYLVSSMPDMPRLRVPRREEEKLMDAVVENAQDLIDVIEWFGPEELAAVKTAFVLWDWINEASEDKLLEEYGVGPGDLAGIVETGEWIASSLARIVEYIGGGVAIRGELELLAKRIRYGVRAELVPLVSIPGIGRVRARRLYDAGYRSLHDLATASPEELMKVPGIGASTVRSILEFFGRESEALSIKGGADRPRRGLEAFFD